MNARNLTCRSIWRSTNTVRTLLVLAHIAVAVAGCGLLPESSFTLSPDSRLPKWYTLANGQSREQIQIRLDYVETPRGRTARFTVTGPGGATLATEEGRLLLPGPWSSRGSSASTNIEYPLYEVVEVKGIRDLIEHRAMEPTFYLSDDKAIWAELVPSDLNR